MIDLLSEIFTYLLLGLGMFAIAVNMIAKKTPTKFYTFEKDRKEDEITDVKKWNLYHGIMFIVYGVLISISGIAVQFISNGYVILGIYFGAFILPVPIMIIIHTIMDKHFTKR